MNSKFFSFISILLGMICLASCGSSNDNPGTSDAKVFNDDNGLTITVNGESFLGATASYVPTDGTNKATIKFYSLFDMSEIYSAMSEDARTTPASTTCSAPGVLPGSKTLSIEITTGSDLSKTQFSGSSSTDYCTYSYTGTLTETTLNVSFNNVTLKDQTLVGTWTPVPATYDNDGEVLTSPAHLVWKSSAQLDLGDPVDAETLLQLVMALPLIESGDNTLSASEMLGEALKSVNFKNDGNIIASYVDIANGATMATQSPANLAQYVVTSSSSMLLYLNPAAIKATQTRSDVSSSLETLMNNTMANAMTLLQTYLGDGMPLSYVKGNNSLTVYLDTEVLLPMLKTLVLPIVTDEEVMAEILDMIASDSSMAEMTDMIQSAIKSIPAVINGTTQLEIGINLQK